MSKQSKERHSCRKEVEEETYKEFIRQKVLKYQHQFPKMSEFAIYQKIGREWQAFNQKQKQQLYNLYVNHNFIPGPTEQLESNKQAKYQKTGQNNEQLISVQKSNKVQENPKEKIQEKIASGVKTRRMAKNQPKETGQHQKSIQLADRAVGQLQMVAQQPQKTKDQPIPCLLLGQTLSKKLKELDESNKQSINEYKAVFEDIHKEHKEVVSCFNKQQVSLELPQKVEEAAQKLKEINKSLQKIEEQAAEEESSQLSPEQDLKLLKQKQNEKQKRDIKRQSKHLRLAIKLKIDQSLKQHNTNMINTKKNPYLTVKLQSKPKIPKKTSEYLQFYKKGYKQLKQQCDFLTGIEITQILTNVWQKQKALQKVELRNKKMDIANDPLEKKIELSAMLARKIGKINFIKTKLKEQYLPQEAHRMWASLPIQSKIKWIYPEKRPYQHLINQTQRPVHGIVRYKSNQSADSHFYDLQWDIFDQAINEQACKCPEQQSKDQKQ